MYVVTILRRRHRRFSTESVVLAPAGHHPTSERRAMCSLGSTACPAEWGRVNCGEKTADGKTENAAAFELIDIDQLLTAYGLSDPNAVSVGQAAQADEYKYKRNDLQDRLIAASNKRCGAYLRVLTSSKSQLKWDGVALPHSCPAPPALPLPHQPQKHWRQAAPFPTRS